MANPAWNSDHLSSLLSPLCSTKSPILICSLAIPPSSPPPPPLFSGSKLRALCKEWLSLHLESLSSFMVSSCQKVLEFWHLYACLYIVLNEKIWYIVLTQFDKFKNCTSDPENDQYLVQVLWFPRSLLWLFILKVSRHYKYVILY